MHKRNSIQLFGKNYFGIGNLEFWIINKIIYFL